MQLNADCDYRCGASVDFAVPDLKSVILGAPFISMDLVNSWNLIKMNALSYPIALFVAASLSAVIYKVRIARLS
jgi:hypothetical protein